MSGIEVVICLVLLLMAVPDVCRKLGRPALAFSIFAVFGIALGPVVSPGVRTMILQAGQVGFLLLLFEVGLEIDLPRFRELLPPLRYAVVWSLVQYPLVFGLGWLVGLSPMECLVGAAALTACSVGMAYPAWKGYSGITADTRHFILNVMVVLETIAILLLAVETVALEKGVSGLIFLKLSGILVTVFLIARFSVRLTELFQAVLERTTRWRVHFLVLLILVVCALGERLGLDAAKTAFFLGLFMSHARHDGRRLEEYMAPISHGFLIPTFFVALGLRVDWHLFLDPLAWFAIGTALVLIGVRQVLHRRWLPTGGGDRAFLLLCPNLTIVALAANAMLDHGTDPRLGAWLVLTGLFMTVTAIFLLPAEIMTGSRPHHCDPRPG